MKTRGTPGGTRSYAEEHRQRKKWLTVVACLAALVVFCTVYALVMPAAALEGDTAYCGKAEHTHTEECYESVLTCGLEEGAEHVHDDSCYEQKLICGETEHVHTDACFAEPVTETAAGEDAETETDANAGTEAAALPDGAQVPENYTEQYTVRDDENGFAVTVYAPEGTVPDGAVLSAELLAEDDAAYAEAEEALAANTDEVQSGDGDTSNTDYGFAAMDIHFTDADGNEVEPNGDVYVVIDAVGLLPEGADPESITVQHHAERDNGEVTVETVADTADETAGVVAAQAAENSENSGVQAAFEVSGFSTFTITYSQQASITVHYVDEDGREIYAPDVVDVSAKNNMWIDLSSYKKEIGGFSYSGTKLNSIKGNNVKWIKYYNKGWHYSSSDSQPTNNGNQWNADDGYHIYIVYARTESKAELTTAETVDSTSQGVHMYMFNYSGAAFNGGSYEPGDTKEGLASATVDENGWPELTGKDGTPKGSSFSNYFGGTASAYNLTGNLDNNGRQVNHLFLKNYYDANGQYYFNSAEYFATLKDDNDDNFTVYDQLGTPSNADSYFYQRGNFMPFNTLDLNTIRNYNLYDDTGAELTEDDLRVNEPLYGFKENNDFYFGMYVWADFYQPQNGMVEDNEGDGSSPMVFDFTGDDDMWVYVDGVLVLDLGGIHDAQSGSINFQTGEVRWTNTKTGEDPNWNASDLHTIFSNAGEEDAVTWKTGTNTFSDGSYHRIQIFYMERGAGASNLKISFNLKTIPDGQVAVTKNVENYYAPQTEDITYTMRIWTWDSDGEEWEPYIGKYTLYEQGDDQYLTSQESGHEGEFSIKYGDTAVFPDIPAGTQVKVQEVAVSDNKPLGVNINEDGYKVTCEVTDSGGQQLEGSSVDENGAATATMPGYGSINVNITNIATFTRPLKLVKGFNGTENNAVPENFEATYTLYMQEPDEENWVDVGSVRYSELENGEYIFWLDTDKNYKIEETFAENDNKGDTDSLRWNRVVVTTNDPADGTVDEEGIVHLETKDATLENASKFNPVDTITMTNYYSAPDVDLTITKVDSADAGIKLPDAEFYVSKETTTGDAESTVYYKYDEEQDLTTWVDSRNAATKLTSSAAAEDYGTFCIHNLEDGSYTLIEVKAPEGYQMPTANITFTVMDGVVEAASLNDSMYSGTDIKVPNISGDTTVLPETGGPGTTCVTIGGLLLMAAAVGGGYRLRRRRGKEGR